MRRHPYMPLVCLSLFIHIFPLTQADASDTIRVVVDSPPLQVRPLTTVASYDPGDASADEPTFMQASAPGWLGPMGGLICSGKPITKCKAPVCPPIPVSGCPTCKLPQRRCGQWELAVQAFYARIKGTLQWSEPLLGGLHPAVDFNDGLGLPGHKWLMEYSARHQFRPHWSCFYSIMPIEVEETYMSPSLPGQVFKTKWEHLYQRVGIMYQPIVTCNASVSVFGTWMFMDQKFTMSSSNHCAAHAAKTIDRTRNMVMPGLEVQKCIRTLCNGGTLSCDNRVGLAFLDGTFGLDVQAGFRFSVPMNCGRWGFARGGYRLIQFNESRDDLRLDHTLEGWFAELGLIF
jgi:hypothetical protein